MSVSPWALRTQKPQTGYKLAWVQAPALPWVCCWALSLRHSPLTCCPVRAIHPGAEAHS
jgi:hypothetical protein